MGTTYKISEVFCDESFSLLAIHSSMEDHNLVYAINGQLKIRLKRSRNDLDISPEVSFPFFEWRDDLNHRYWTLTTNTGTKEEYVDDEGLFQNESSFTRFHLVPEHKEVDYFLKIEQDDTESATTLVRSILCIPGVITAYSIDITNLKSKRNLIF